MDVPYVFIAEVRDGTVTRAWHYYDRLLVLEQEGVGNLDKLFGERAPERGGQPSWGWLSNGAEMAVFDNFDSGSS